MTNLNNLTADMAEQLIINGVTDAANDGDYEAQAALDMIAEGGPVQEVA